MMSNLTRKIQSILLAGALALTLAGCGGSDAKSVTATTTTNKTASWANVAASSGDRQVTISWDKPGSAASTTSTATTPASTYNIYWSANDPTMAKRTKIENVTSPFVHTGLAANDDPTKPIITYYYVVTEKTTGVEGPDSFVVSATPMAVVPAAPVGLRAKALDGAVDIEFTGTQTANTTYTLVWKKLGEDKEFEISNLSSSALSAATPYRHTALMNDGEATYKYWLKAVRNGIESNRSNPITIYPQAVKTQEPVQALGLKFTSIFGTMSTVTTAGKPGRPSGVKVVAGNQQVQLDWTAVTAPTTTPTLYDIVKTDSTKTIIQSSGSSTTENTTTVSAPTAYYDIYWDTKSFTSSSLPANVIRTSLTSFTHTGLAKNDGSVPLTTYYYAIRAVAIPNDPALTKTYPSDASSIVSAVPTPKMSDVPSALTIVGGDQKADLSWNKDASGNTNVSYIVYAVKSETKPTVCKAPDNKIATATAYSYSHTGLMPGDTWYYCVTSGAEAESEASAIVSYALPKAN